MFPHNAVTQAGVVLGFGRSTYGLDFGPGHSPAVKDEIQRRAHRPPCGDDPATASAPYCTEQRPEAGQVRSPWIGLLDPLMVAPLMVSFFMSHSFCPVRVKTGVPFTDLVKSSGWSHFLALHRGRPPPCTVIADAGLMPHGCECPLIAGGDHPQPRGPGQRAADQDKIKTRISLTQLRPRAGSSLPDSLAEMARPAAATACPPS